MDQTEAQKKLALQYPNLAHYAPVVLAWLKYPKPSHDYYTPRLERMLYCARMAHGQQPSIENRTVVINHCKDVPADYEKVASEISKSIRYTPWRNRPSEEQLVRMTSDVLEGWQRARRDGLFTQLEGCNPHWATWPLCKQFWPGKHYDD